MNAQPGWYPCPTGDKLLRWYDGNGWTATAKPMPDEQPEAQPVPVVHDIASFEQRLPVSPMMTRPTSASMQTNDDSGTGVWSAHDGGGVGAGTAAFGPVGTGEDHNGPAPTRKLRFPSLGSRLPSLSVIGHIPWRALIAPAFAVALIAGVIVDKAREPDPAATLTAGFVAAFGLDINTKESECIAEVAADTERTDVAWPATPADRSAIWEAAAGDCLNPTAWIAAAPLLVDPLGLPLQSEDRDCVAKRIPSSVPTDLLAAVDFTQARPFAASEPLAAAAGEAVESCVDNMVSAIRTALVVAAVPPETAACAASGLMPGNLTALITAGGLSMTAGTDNPTIDTNSPMVAAALAACAPTLAG